MMPLARPMTLLILGGTGDARRLAQALIKSAKLSVRPLEIIYTLAGLVRCPQLECETVSGGFTQFGGLASYIRERKIDVLIDCTHPYALVMSRAAVSAAAETGIACWRLERPAWQPQPGDDWRMFNGWDELLAQASHYRSVFITSGQLPASVLEHFGNIKSGPCSNTATEEPQKQLLRTAVAAEHELPSSMQWLKAIGPFELEGELALMKEQRIDCLISKNSGGQATEAKLTAARMLGIPVLMLARLPLPTCDRVFDSLAAAQQHIERTFL